MPHHPNNPPTLDYQTPPPRIDWSSFIARNAPLVCWAVALLLYPLWDWQHLQRRTSGSTNPQVDALQWAIAAVLIRALIGLVCRQRTWWSLAYVALHFLLPILANTIANHWWASHPRRF